MMVYACNLSYSGGKSQIKISPGKKLARSHLNKQARLISQLCGRIMEQACLAQKAQDSI
jgi:hypothetical protein